MKVSVTVGGAGLLEENGDIYTLPVCVQVCVCVCVSVKGITNNAIRLSLRQWYLIEVNRKLNMIIIEIGFTDICTSSRPLFSRSIGKTILSWPH